jgi:P27 family predicted phage terminase small subunit
MGERGPAKKPTNLILLSGNAGHHKKASLEDEPKPKNEKPRCPTDLQGIARKEWRRITSELYDLGLVSKIDLQAIKTYCINVQIRDELWEYLRTYETILDNGKKLTGISAYLAGRNSQNTPEIKAMREAETTILKICQQFGMTASSRSRMKVSKPVEWESSGIEGFLND